MAGAASLSASQCKKPLDSDTLDQLQISSFSEVQLQPGQTRQFQVFIPLGYAPNVTVPACVVWTVEPAGKGAAIDQAGLLTVSPNTAAGSKFTVTANIESGRAERGATVLVYTPQAQPLVGLWKQEEQYDCGSGESAYARPIGELEFRASGWFSVTWEPFETYRDYWGNYKTGNSKETVSLKIGGGNFIPRDFRGEGSYKLVDEKTLELRGLYLGSREKDAGSASNPIPQCRYLFKLTSRPQ